MPNSAGVPPAVTAQSLLRQPACGRHYDIGLGQRSVDGLIQLHHDLVRCSARDGEPEPNTRMTDWGGRVGPRADLIIPLAENDGQSEKLKSVIARMLPVEGLESTVEFRCQRICSGDISRRWTE